MVTAHLARAEDRPTVIGLWRACDLTRPWNDPDRDFELALAAENAAILLIDTRGTVMVGFDGHRGWIYYLGVHPDHRRAGLGRALMAAGEAWARARGVPKLQLMIRQENDAARGFYRALGYEVQPVVTVGKFLGGPER